MSARSAYRPEIDGLRALAVVAVVAFHGWPAALPGGFLGVDIFFVISGYVVTGGLWPDLQRGASVLPGFFARRARRLLPVLVPVLLATWLAAWWVAAPDDVRQIGQTMAAGAAFVANFVFLRGGGYFDREAAAQPLLHLWSLGVEAQFYLLWPACLLLVRRIPAERLALRHLGLLTVILASFGAGIWLQQTDPVSAFFAPQGRLWEPALGGLLAIWQQRLPRPDHNFAPVRGWGAVGALAVILLALRWGAPTQAFPGWQAVLVCLATLALLGQVPGTRVYRLLAARWPVALGQVSYPFYLWHWPLLWLVWSLAGGLPPFALTGMRLLAIALALVLALASWRWLEQPLRRLRGAGPLTGLLLALVVVGALGQWTAAQQGFIGRLPPSLQPLARLRGPADFGGRSFPDLCVDAPRQTTCHESRRPLVMVWGDSHAQALLPGLVAARQTQQVGVAAWTGCGNPPVLGEWALQDARCGSVAERQAGNRTALERIATWQPDLLILHARWSSPDYRFDPVALAQALAGTQAEVLRRSPRTRVVVLGPVPVWQDSLAHVLLRTASRESLQQLPQAWQAAGLVPETAAFDRAFGRAVQAQQMAYWSAWDLLCAADRCLTRLGDSPQDLTAMDYGHLSPRAAVWLVARLPALRASAM